jgi:hexosaminidase
VIPEIEMPGHARAAIKAMESRYKKLMAEGKNEEAEAYRLIDPEDKSEYTSAQNYHDNVVCVTRESVYRFYEIVLDDIISMYKEAGVPLVMFQVAGDEVPEGSWTKSPMAMEFLKNNPAMKSARDLQPYFFRKIVKMIEDKGIAIGGWEEMAMKPEGEGWIPNPEFANKQIYPFVWNSLRGNMDLGYKLANGGYPVILCNVTNYYFDMAYNKDPREPGLYWGGFVNTKNAFRFAPYDIFQAMMEDPSGDKLGAEAFARYEKLKPVARKNIIGLQAQLWSETIKGQDMLEYDYLPKMLGLSWSAWNGTPAWSLAGDAAERDNLFHQSWNEFINLCANKELPRLDYFSGGYNYRISPPGISVVDGKVAANTEFPSMTIRYTTDGSEPVESSALYEAPFEAKGTIKMRTFIGTGRSSYTTTLVVE